MISKSDLRDYFREREELPEDIMPRELQVPTKEKQVISVIGPRRAGKTYYFFSLAKKLGSYAHLNFEDTRLAEATGKEIRDILREYIALYGKRPKHIFLDEVQEIPGWDRAVRELHDLGKYRLFVTSSSSKLLSKEISSRLRGRSLSFLILPFSFREFLRYRKTKTRNLSRDEEAIVRSGLSEYLEFGGFPDVVKTEHKLRILKEYYEMTLFRDFVERHGVLNIELARTLHAFIVQNHSREISVRAAYNRISSVTRAGKNTVYDYMEKLEDTMFFFMLKKYSPKAHLRETWPKKVYLCDTGLSKVVRPSPDLGRLMENAVFLDLLREKNTNPLLETYYLKLKDGEVDFVITEGNMPSQLLQVTLASSEDELERREVRSLIKAGRLLRCKDLRIITWDHEDEKNVRGKRIVLTPLWKWLLQRRL